MTSTAHSATLALQRAMPMTRLLDCGMDYADAARLLQRTSEGHAWDLEAESLAAAQLARAASAAQRGQMATALDCQAWGIANLVFAQMALNFDTPRKRALYQQLAQASRQLAQWSGKQIERVELPFVGAHLIGWLVRPQVDKILGTVVLFGGQSGWGMAYLPIARALARRGVATLLAEGPGQGETRLTQGIYLDIDVTGAYQQFVSYAANDPSLGAVGIWGNSIGGLWAAKTAAADARIQACCVNGAFAHPRLLPFRTFTEQAAAMLGNEDQAAIQRNFDRLRLRPGHDRIACPLLVLHGGEDPLIALEDQQPFLDAASSDKVTFKAWPDGEHTLYNHANERTQLVADWFAEHFERVR
jgi:alpha-beta hydrolase superfamily lysophospholipase